MKVVIEIPDRYTKLIGFTTPELEVIAKAVIHGTPLPDDAIIIDAKEQSDYVFVEKAKYNDLVEAASKALTDRIKKSLYEGVIAESEAESEGKNNG